MISLNNLQGRVMAIALSVVCRSISNVCLITWVLKLKRKFFVYCSQHCPNMIYSYAGSSKKSKIVFFLLRRVKYLVWFCSGNTRGQRTKNCFLLTIFIQFYFYFAFNTVTLFTCFFMLFFAVSKMCTILFG